MRCAIFLIAYLGTIGFASEGIAASQPAGSCASVRITADPEYPPLHWYDGQTLRGASIAVTTRVFHDIGVPTTLVYTGPWARALATAKAGEVDVITTLKDAPERREFLAFPSTAAFVNPIVVFVARDRPFAYAKWADLVGHQGGLTRGNIFGGGFDEYMAHNLTVEPANTPEINFAKLGRGRIDYFLTGFYTGKATLIKMHEESNFVALRPSLTETLNYVGFVKASPCVRHLPAFDRRLAELVRSGVVAQILEESILQWRSEQAKRATPAAP